MILSKLKAIFVIIATLGAVTRAHMAKDCFEKTQVLGGVPGTLANTDHKDDLDLLETID